MFKKAFVAVLSVVALTVAGCGSPEDTPPAASAQQLTVTDINGREITFDKEPQRVVAAGPRTLRMLTYLQITEKLVGVEQIDSDSKVSKPYAYVHREEFGKLPSIGKGGPGAEPDMEALIGVNPEVIVATWDAKTADDVTATTGIPVITVLYEDLFDPKFEQSLHILGEAFAKQERATTLIKATGDMRDDLKARGEKVPAEQRPSTYVGGVSFKGPHGITGTHGAYPPLAAIGANNAAALAGNKAVTVDIEDLVNWNPDVVFLTASNMNMIRDDVAARPQLYDEVAAFHNGKLYSQLPYNFYGANIEIAIADAYYAGTVLAPEAFSDIDPVKKFDEITQLFLGKKLYADFEAAGLTFGKVEL
ncbi:ABC transporter substrate-binding protein [Corynebacterium hindlerae]|uniref:ABC transporter substrate-binding protein n=1 Tax=Corynebacterium hindlerae TaxID=699041 RepID=UPI0031B6CB4F